MQKTLGDAARHIKSIIPPETTEMYEINPVLLNIANEESIREGVCAFRLFLIRLYDVLAGDAHLYDAGKRSNEHLSAAYFGFPFIDNLQRLLLNIGIRGVLSEDGKSIIGGHDILNEKISASKNMELLRFLVDCGIVIDGVDPNNKRQKLAEVGMVYFSYPDDLTMLTGLKVMAMAEQELRKSRFHYIFMRCDYRALMKEEISVTTLLKEIIAPLSPEVQDFLLRMHHRHLDKGFDCTVEVWGFWVKIKHSSGRKELWGVNTSVNQGYKISVKAHNTPKYADAISKLPLAVQEMIASGYGCGKKRFGICNAGCEGLQISLDDTIMDISDGIEAWFDLELSCLRRKK